MESIGSFKDNSYKQGVKEEYFSKIMTYYGPLTNYSN